MMPESFPFMDVCYMNFDEGYVDSCQCISYGYTRMCKGAWVNDNRVDFASSFVYAINYCTFMI
jgi:hypothetical protein